MMHRVTLNDDPNLPRALWLHGWGLDHRSLLPLARLMTGRLASELVDLPGFGQSPALAKGVGTGDYALALAAEQAVQDQPVILIGHSFGMRVAVQYASAYPAKVAAIVCIGGAGIPRDRSLGWKARAFVLRMVGRLAGLADRILGTGFRTAYTHKFGSADYRNAGDLRETFVRVVNEDLTEQARKVRCPVLLIYGAEDREAPVEIGEKYARVMTNATLYVVPTFGHFDILDTGAHQCQNLINQFLDRSLRS